MKKLFNLTKNLVFGIVITALLVQLTMIYCTFFNNEMGGKIINGIDKIIY